MYLADLAERLSEVVLSGLAIKVNSYWILTRIHLEHRWRVEEETLILGEVIYTQRGRHDDQLEWRLELHT